MDGVNIGVDQLKTPVLCLGSRLPHDLLEHVKGPGPIDSKLQDLHNTEQQQGVQDEYQ